MSSETDSFAGKGSLTELTQPQQDLSILWWLDITVAF